MSQNHTIRNARIKHHLNLVDPIAGHYARRSGLDRDDLKQVGRLGLLRAAEGYEQGQDKPFEVYARPHIRGAILHYLRDSVGLVRLPRRLQEQAQNTIKTPLQNRNKLRCQRRWNFRSMPIAVVNRGSP